MLIRRSSPYYLLFLLAVVVGGLAGEVGAGDVQFTVPGDAESVNSEGVVSLVWDGKEGVEYEVQQGDSVLFENAKVRYAGPDHGSVLTGFEEGSYYFRVRDAGGEWSDVVRVDIEFMDRQQVVLLMVVGGLVFLATVGALLAGHFRQRGQEVA